MTTEQKRDVEWMLQFNNDSTKCTLKEVLFVKDQCCNFLSLLDASGNNSALGVNVKCLQLSGLACGYI